MLGHPDRKLGQSAGKQLSNKLNLQRLKMRHVINKEIIYDEIVHPFERIRNLGILFSIYLLY